MKSSILFIVFTIIICASCQKEALSPEQEAISALEQQLDKEMNPKKNNELIQLYRNYTLNHPSDEEWCGRYMYRAGHRQIATKNYVAAISNLKYGAKNCGESSITPSTLFLLANTLRSQFNQLDHADIYYQALVEGYPSSKYASQAKDVMQQKKPLKNRIKEKELEMNQDTTGFTPNKRMARKLLELYKLYSSVHASTADAPDYLYKAHKMALTTMDQKEAIRLCEKLFTKYPKHPKAPTAMFFAAFNYQNHFNDLEKAGELYKKFIATYPNDAFAKDAKISLDNLELSPDEMLKKIQQQNQEK